MKFEEISFTPFIFFFSLLMIYPIILSATMISSQDLLSLFNNDLYLQSLTNLLLFTGIAVPIKLVLAMFISGILSGSKRNPFVKILSVVYPLPWAIPAMSAALSFRWSLDYDFGIINKILSDVGLPRVPWLLTYPAAMASIIIFHVWKWTPLWTLMLFSARQVIPEELYEAARIDGASPIQMFKNVTFPLIKGTFFICLLLSSIWSMGEFEAIWLVTLGGPNQTTHTITTLGIREVFFYGNLGKGIAIYFSILPLIAAFMAIILFLLRRET
ncbi:MAG: carbohydrate ABC transporter permease [Nitrososphaeria archaeon]